MCVGWWVGAGVRGACGVSAGDRVCSYCDGGGEGKTMEMIASSHWNPQAAPIGSRTAKGGPELRPMSASDLFGDQSAANGQRTLRRAAASASSEGGGRPPGFGNSGNSSVGAPSMKRDTHAAKLRGVARLGRAF